MPRLLHINIGFVTNSSSVVYHFPKALLENKTIQAFLKAFEVDSGFIGRDLWSRNTCGTLALTREQKLEVQRQLNETEYGTPPGIDVNDDSTFVMVYGDEHRDIASILIHMLTDLAEKELGVHIFGQDYN